MLQRLLSTDSYQRLGWFAERVVGVVSNIRGGDHDENPLVLVAGEGALRPRGLALQMYEPQRGAFVQVETDPPSAAQRLHRRADRRKRLLVARAGRVINFWASPENPRAGQPTPLRHVEVLMGLEDIAMRQGERLYGAGPGVYALDREPQQDLVTLLRKRLRGSEPIRCSITNTERYDTLGSPVWP
jgi:hypothetical protein